MFKWTVANALISACKIPFLKRWKPNSMEYYAFFLQDACVKVPAVHYIVLSLHLPSHANVLCSFIFHFGASSPNALETPFALDIIYPIALVYLYHPGRGALLNCWNLQTWARTKSCVRTLLLVSGSRDGSERLGEKGKLYSLSISPFSLVKSESKLKHSTPTSPKSSKVPGKKYRVCLSVWRVTTTTQNDTPGALNHRRRHSHIT